VRDQKREVNQKFMGLLDLIIIVLLIVWFGGFFLHIAGLFIHIFLVLAVVAFILRLLGVKI